MTGIDEYVRNVVNEKAADIKYTVRRTSSENEFQMELSSQRVETFLRSGIETLEITAQNEQKGFHHTRSEETLWLFVACHPLAVQGLESTTRLYIDPVLLASARIVDGIKLYVEKEIPGKRSNTAVEHVFNFKDKIISVTEAKIRSSRKASHRMLLRWPWFGTCAGPNARSIISEDVNDGNSISCSAA